MQQVIKVSMGLLVGCVIGAGAISALQAQVAKKPAYVIADVEVSDPTAFSAYAAKVPATLQPYNGRVIVRAKPIGKEGSVPPGNIVVIAFDSLEDAEKWYGSPAYTPLIAERQKAAKTQLYMVEGLPQ